MNAKQFKALGFHSLEDLERFLDREEIKQLVGKNYDHYRAIWVRDFDKFVNGVVREKVSGRFNWLCFLGFPIWVAYRKMYGMFFAYAGVMAVISFLEEYYQYTIPTGAFFGLGLVLAFMSRDLYLQHLVQLSKKMDELRDFKTQNFIKLHGGVSALYAWLSLPVFILLMIPVMYVGGYLGGHGNVFDVSVEPPAAVSREY